MAEAALLQRVLDCAEKIVADADKDLINGGRYFKKAVLDLSDAFADSSAVEDNKHALVRHLLCKAVERQGAEGSSEGKAVEIPAQVEDEDTEISEEWQSRYGSVVWVKNSKNDPWWPSYICDPRYLDEDVPKGLREQAFENVGKKYLVYYYGEASKNKHGFVKSGPSQIREYEEFREELETQAAETKTKTLTNALSLADREVIRSPSERIVWFEYLNEINFLLRKMKKKAVKQKGGPEAAVPASKADKDDKEEKIQSNRPTTYKKKNLMLAGLVENTVVSNDAEEVPSKKRTRVSPPQGEDGKGAAERTGGLVHKLIEENIPTKKDEKQSKKRGRPSKAAAPESEEEEEKKKDEEKKEEEKVEREEELPVEAAVVAVVEVKVPKKKGRPSKKPALDTIHVDKEEAVTAVKVEEQGSSDSADVLAEVAVEVEEAVMTLPDTAASSSSKVENVEISPLLVSSEVEEEVEADSSPKEWTKTSVKAKALPKVKGKRGRPARGSSAAPEDEEDTPVEAEKTAKELEVVIEEEKLKKEHEVIEMQTKERLDKFEKEKEAKKLKLQEKRQKDREEKAEKEEKIKEEEKIKKDEKPKKSHKRKVVENIKEEKVKKEEEKVMKEVEKEEKEDEVEWEMEVIDMAEKFVEEVLEEAQEEEVRPKKAFYPKAVVEGTRRSSRTVVYCEDDSEEEAEEEEESEEEGESDESDAPDAQEVKGEKEVQLSVVTGLPKRKCGRPPKGSAPRPKKAVVKGRRGRPPKNPAAVPVVVDAAEKKGRLMKKVAEKKVEAAEKVVDMEDEGGGGGEKEEQVEQQEDEEANEEEEEEEDEEDEEEKVAALIKSAKTQMLFDSETPSARLVRLLRLLTSLTRENTITLEAKAILTIDKIDGMNMGIEDLKSSGAAEQIAMLRKHSNAAVAARAKQLRAKWIEVLRKDMSVPVVAVAVSASSVSVAAAVVQEIEVSGQPAVAEVSVEVTETQEQPSTNGNHTVTAPPLPALTPTLRALFQSAESSSSYEDVFVPSVFDIEIVPAGVRSSVARCRGVRMLHTVLGNAPSVRSSSAAIWLEDRVFNALCAVAVETSTQAMSAASSSGGKGETFSLKGGVTAAGGDTTLTTQGAGSAVNRYLANITRLTFALQTREMRQLRGRILQCFQLGDEMPATLDELINATVTAKSTGDLEEINAALQI